MPDDASPLTRALALHRAGRLDEAAALYRDMLAADPQDADALQLLGVVADATGDSARGAELIGQALLLRDSATYRSNLGMVLGHLGQHEAALDQFERALAQRPDYPEALNNLGVSLEALHRLSEAETALRRAVAARPGYSEALGNLGNVLRSQGRLDEAAASYELAVAHSPVASRAVPGGALDEPPGPPEMHANLGQVLGQLGRFEEAVAALQRALRLRPDYRDALTSLGIALRGLGRLAESEAAQRRAVALRPAETGGYNDLAITLHAQDRPHEALAVLDLAAALDPENAETHHHRAMMLLHQGRLREGWDSYEWRLRTKQAGDSHVPFANQTPWRGEPIEGRTILLAPEQGFGDLIQFSRYVPLLAARGARVLLGSPPPLLRLMRSLPSPVELVATGTKVPRYDLHCHLLSLPRAFRTTLDTVPAPVPYLHAEPGAASYWAERLGNAGPGLRVGVVWAGNPRHLGDRERSLPFSALAPLWRVPGVRWFSLQVGPRAADLATADAPEGGITDLAPWLTDFAETAAALTALDLVITADTAVAHLAGAMGRAVWVLLPRVSDWRWLRTGERSPWYPTMRLFRQDDRRTWPPVLEEVAASLRTQARLGTTVTREVTAAGLATMRELVRDETTLDLARSV